MLNDNKLKQKAIEIIKLSYSPYSNFAVSAVIETKSGQIFTGINIENASYSLTVCAERVAIFNAISSGEKEFVQMLIFHNGDILPYPCGACLQVISEFVNDDFKIIIANKNEKKQYLLKQLLPETFKL